MWRGGLRLTGGIIRKKNVGGGRGVQDLRQKGRRLQKEKWVRMILPRRKNWIKALPGKGRICCARKKEAGKRIGRVHVE